jgi:hypothetical protein
MDVIIPNDQNNDNKIIDMVMANRQESETWLQSSHYLEEWKSWNDLYRGVPRKKPYNWMSNKFIPIVMSKVETAVSNLVSLLFAGNPPFDIRPREPGDEKQAMLTKRLLTYQMDEAGVQAEFTNFLRGLAIYGTSIAKVSFEWKTENKVQMVPSNPVAGLMSAFLGTSMGMQPQTYQATYGLPVLTTCNIGDIFPDPNAIDIQDSWVIHRLFRTRAYLVWMAQNYPDIYNSEVMKLTDEDGTEEREAKADIQGSNGRLNNPQVTRSPGLANIQLNEWHGLYDLDGDGEPERCVFTVANGKYLIRKQSRPYWHGKNPFIKATYIPALNEFYGIGIPELLEDLQNNLNEIYNQRNDNIQLALNRPTFYKKNAGINPNKLIIKPGGLYGTDEDIPNSISPMQIDLYTRDSFAQTQDIERWAQEVTAVTKLTLGMQGKDANDTATGMSILQRASGDRFMTIARGIESSAFKEMLRMFYQLDCQFIDQEQLFGILGQSGMEWIKVSPEAVRRDYDLVPTGIFSMENKGQKAVRLLQFKQATRDDPSVKQNTLNRKIYAALEIGDNPDEVMRSDAEMMEIMRMAQGLAGRMAAEQLSRAGIGGPEKPKGTGSSSTQFQKGISTGQNQMPPPTPIGAGNPASLPS